MRKRRGTSDAGFSLIELAIVLVIAGIVMKYGLQSFAAYAEQGFRDATTARLSAVEEALVLFVQRNRRLPCPANGTLPITNAQNGVEQLDPASLANETTVCAAGNQFSVVPWRTLGLASQDVASDGWGRRITYRVANGANGLTRNRTVGGVDGMNMTDCKASATDNTALNAAACPAGTPFRAPLAFIHGKGIQVQDGNGNWLRHEDTTVVNAGGAALLLVSHGKDGRGAYTRDGAKLPDPTGALQLANVSHTAVPAIYRIALQNENASAGANFFDDVVLAPTIQSIAVRAGLGPQ